MQANKQAENKKTSTLVGVNIRTKNTVMHTHAHTEGNTFYINYKA